MLLCFGAAWPFSIYRSYASRTNGGKSLVFLFVVFTGYISGTIHKLRHNHDLVIWLYVLNGFMVLVDILIYFRNNRFREDRALPNVHKIFSI